MVGVAEDENRKRAWRNNNEGRGGRRKTGVAKAVCSCLAYHPSSVRYVSNVMVILGDSVLTWQRGDEKAASAACSGLWRNARETQPIASANINASRINTFSLAKRSK